MTNFHTTFTSKKSFAETVEAIETAVAENKFAVLAVHDVQATFASKGIEYGPYKIIEFCRAPAAKAVLDAEPLIGLFLPCPLIVFEQKGQVTVSAMKPTVIGEFFPAAKLGDLPQQIEADIEKVLDSVR